MITPIPPGQTVSMNWDQTDQQGNQVPDGLYGFAIQVFDPDFVLQLICAPVQVGTSCAAPTQYGFGGAGSGGNVPAITSVGGFPSIGNLAFDVGVSNALGAAPAFLFLSLADASLDFGFATVWVDPNLLFLTLTTTLGGAPGTAGAGIGFFGTPIPNNAGLIGLEFFGQIFVSDPMANGGLSHTEGLRVGICPA